MFDAAEKALSQMLSPPFRTILWKSIGLAVAILIVAVIALTRLLGWLETVGIAWMEGAVGPVSHTPLVVLGWIIAVMLGLGLIAGAVFLMPAVSALVSSFFADDIAEQVERLHYPLDPPGVALPLPRAIQEGVRTALLALLIYLCCVPFLLFAGFGAVIFFIATAYLLGREYFELAAMRFHPPAEAKALRKANMTRVFIAGLFIAAFVSIPIVNLATPLFATAFMVHIHKRISGSKNRELLEPARRSNQLAG
jgi:CysZ protein